MPFREAGQSAKFGILCRMFDRACRYLYDRGAQLIHRLISATLSRRYRVRQVTSDFIGQKALSKEP